ncbi:hypothetical protein VUR80DRAFT_838 [Thermomyces stellatus]
MFFTDFYKSPKVTFAKFRHVHTPPPDYGDPDLVSKDKVKQKAAVKKYLDEKIRSDWEFEWPPRTSASSPAVKSDATVSLASPDASAIAVRAEKDPQELATKPVGDRSNNTSQSYPGDVTGLASPPPDAGDSPTADKNETATHIQDISDDVPPPESNRQDSRSGPHDPTLDDGNESDDDTASTYSVFSEDELHFRPRLEWESEISDEDSSSGDDGSASCHFRFESPDTVGETIRAEALSKKEKRRRAARDEAAWNDGLACFEARRDAWTGAKTVRLKKKPASPTSGLASLSPRRLFFRSSPPTSPLSSSPNDRPSGDVPRSPSDSSEVQKEMAPLSKNQTKSSSHSIPASQLPIETIIPIAPPLLPPANAMRASISPSVFPTLYDKLVVNGLTPSCPVNLSDMIRACVVGWKRDGEWPPRATVDPPPARRKKRKSGENCKRKSGDNGTGQRRMSLGLLGKDDGGIRRSMQKFFGHGNAG